MPQQRKVAKIIKGKPTMEGAGVLLKRIFGYYETKLMDPFLLLDHFGSDKPEDYLAGFPWHPHRGIETVTYMIEGTVEHGDSMKNKGVIKSGDVQWMTAGSGIIHQEMPKLYKGTSRGFQLWVNLPAKNKMMPPRYRDINSSAIPETIQDGCKIKVICGEFNKTKGPAKEIILNPTYLDINIPTGKTLTFPIADNHTAFAYVFEGEAYFGAQKESVKSGNLALFSTGNEMVCSAGPEPARFIFAAAAPLKEPIAWQGPIVMNTKAELAVAFEEYYNGTFIK